MLHEILTEILAFIQAHAAWAAPIAGLLAFFKALAFVSLVVPGITIMLALGALIGASGIDFWSVWIAVSIGAALGDWVSYLLGWYLKDRAHRMWPFTRYPELLPKGERFFLRWGVMSVALCRFFSPLRATVPLLCGIFEMPSLPFQLANWFSAFLWAAALLTPGSLLAHWVL